MQTVEVKFYIVGLSNVSKSSNTGRCSILWTSKNGALVGTQKTE